jgi:hypothetical protein
MRKKRMDKEKGNSWKEEKENRAGQEAAGKANRLLMWRECEGAV